MRTISICYVGIFIATVNCSIGWFIAAENNELLKQMPVVLQWFHNTIGVLSYAIIVYLPIMAGSDLLSTFLIQTLARYFLAWSQRLKDVSDQGSDAGFQNMLM